MKDETGGVDNEEFVGLKPKRYLFWADNRNEHKKAKGVNKNVATISHSKYKDVLLNIRCLRYWMNKIQSKNHNIRVYEINKFSVQCFDALMMIKYISQTMDMMN